MKKLHQVRESQIVRVTDGPFAGFLGEVTAVGEQSINVDVQVYGRVTPVVVLVSGRIELVAKNSN
jgi:transcription antitermination factor NusG